MDITQDDVLAYALGQVEDPARCRRIEAAIDASPEAAQWLAEFDRTLRPSAGGGEALQREFLEISHENCVRIAWDEASFSVTGQRSGALCWDEGGEPARANASSGQSGNLTIRFEQLPPGVRPAALIAIVPDAVIHRLTLGKERGAEAPGTVAFAQPMPQSNQQLGSAAAHSSSYSLAADTAGPSADDAQHFLMSDHEGLIAWLEQRDPDMTYLGYSLQTRERLLPVARLRYYAPGDLAATQERRFDLKQAKRDAAMDRVLTGMETLIDSTSTPEPLRRVLEQATQRRVDQFQGSQPVKGFRGNLKASPQWSVELIVGDPRDADRLTAEQMRELPRRMFEVVPLVAATGDTTYEGMLRQSHGSAWNDPEAVHFVQFVVTV